MKNWKILVTLYFMGLRSMHFSIMIYYKEFDCFFRWAAMFFESLYLTYLHIDLIKRDLLKK